MIDDMLDGVTVIDAAQAPPGPHACALLADLGADVIALDPPGGKTAQNYFDGLLIPTIDRNKRSMVLDLKADESNQVLDALVEAADVFVHNNRPDVSERLGCGYDRLSEINPSLVYCSVTGFGESGPYRDRPMTARLAAALSGMMWVGGSRDTIRPGNSGGLAQATGYVTAFAIVSAIRHMERTGDGQKIETSLFDTATQRMSSYYTLADKEGSIPDEKADTLQRYAPLGVFETGTGPIFLGVPFQYLWERLCDAIDRPELKADERFETHEARLEHRDELRAELNEAFSKHDRETVLDRLLEAGVTASELLTAAEAVENPQVQERGVVQTTLDQFGDEVVVAATPARFDGNQPQIRHPTPRVGQDSREILAEHGFSDPEIDRFIREDVVSEEIGESSKFE